jgi:GT2 family glycosyltransferase
MRPHEAMRASGASAPPAWDGSAGSDREPGKDLTISVVIPSYRRAASLNRCLEALAAQTRAPSEVVVVAREDDGETRKMLDGLLLDLPLHVQLVREGGVRAAMTCGLAAARSEIVAFTDDDTAPRNEWVAGMATRFASDEGIGAVGGRDVVHTDTGILGGAAEEVGRVRWYGRVFYYHHFESRLQDVQFLKGANMSFRRSALAEFDRALRTPSVQWACDTEATLSVWHRGWRVVYDPAVVVDHYPAPRFDEDRRDRPTVRNRSNAAHNELYLFLKHLPAWQKPIIALYATLVGYRNAPGLALFFEGLVRDHDRASVAMRFVAATMGRLLALWTYARYLAAGVGRRTPIVSNRSRMATG